MSNGGVGQNLELQFDTAVTGSDAIAGAVTCRLCQRTLQSEYYDVSGHPTCADCRNNMEALTETPTGAGPLLKAGAFGLGAGIAGAVIYYAVMAIANLEIGIVAILIGYMVGYAVRRGAGGRGGRRFQVLAVALTYAAVALAYTPIAMRAVMKRENKIGASASTGATTTDGNAEKSLPSKKSLSTSEVVIAFAVLGAFIAALPILVIVGSFPSGLISAAIIFFGMKQAWRMTAAAALEISGPYRVGAPPVASA